MITPELIHSTIERLHGDKNAYRIANHLNYLGYNLGLGDMNAIRDILGEAHPDLRDDGKERAPTGRRKTSRNHQKQGTGYHKRVKGGAA